MTPESKKKLRDLLIGHEDYKQFAYTDTTGHLTIGIGRNLTDRGVSTSEALAMLDNDIIYFVNRLNHYLTFFDALDDIRKIVLIDMCFNLGIHGLLAFERMLEAMKDNNFKLAAIEMLDSKWAGQVKGRAEQLAAMMRDGEG